MKTYNERLPLIDAAIEATDGDIERIKDYRKTDTYIKYTVKLGYFSVDSQWACHGETICTHDEYEQRARELGYKPKEQDMNDWYEKGELLVAGSKHEVFNGKDWIPAKFIGIDHDNRGLVFKTREGYLCYEKIRPLRTETDKLIEQMERSFESTGCVFTNDHRALAEHLIEQGYRKIKPMSEDEFLAECLKFMNLKNYDYATQNAFCEMARFIHRAGCRFLDQGE